MENIKEAIELCLEVEAEKKPSLSEEMIRFVGSALKPIIPQTAEEILRRYGTVIEMGEPLFPRRD